jgi:hypothetical protein
MHHGLVPALSRHSIMVLGDKMGCIMKTKRPAAQQHCSYCRLPGHTLLLVHTFAGYHGHTLSKESNLETMQDNEHIPHMMTI